MMSITKGSDSEELSIELHSQTLNNSKLIDKDLDNKGYCLYSSELINRYMIELNGKTLEYLDTSNITFLATCELKLINSKE